MCQVAKISNHETRSQTIGNKMFFFFFCVMMNCRYRNDTYSFSSMLYSTFKTASFSKSTHYIYTTLKYLNHWANCLHIQNLTVTKNASLLSASNLSPPLFFAPASLLQWLPVEITIEKNVTEPNKLMETVEQSVTERVVRSSHFCSQLDQFRFTTRSD